MKKHYSIFFLSIIFFFLSCSLAFGFVSNRTPVRDRTDDPGAIKSTGQYYSKSGVPYFIDGDGNIDDLTAGTGGGGAVTACGSDGSSVSGASNLWVDLDTTGTSTTVVPDGTGGQLYTMAFRVAVSILQI